MFQRSEEASLSQQRDSQFTLMLSAERTRLIKLCAHLTGNPDGAEDLAQETLLEAWRNRHKLQQTDKQEGCSRWLAAIRLYRPVDHRPADLYPQPDYRLLALYPRRTSRHCDHSRLQYSPSAGGRR